MLPAINVPEIAKEKEHKLNSFGFLKIFSLFLLGSAANFFVVLYALKFFKNLETGDFIVLTLLVAASLVFTILDAFLVPNMITLAGTTVLKTAASFILFFSSLVPPNILAPGSLSFYILITSSALFFFLTLSGLGRGKGIINNSISVKFFLSAKPVLTKTVSGLLIFLSLIFYLAYFEWGYWNDVLGKKISDATFANVNPILNILIPGISVTQTTDEFFSKIAEQELQKLSAKSLSGEDKNEFNLNLLTPNERAKLIEKTAETIKNSMEKIPAIGLLQKAEKINDTLYRIIKNYLTQIYNEVGKTFFGIIFTLLVFFTLRSSIIVFYWLIELAAFIIFKLFLILGFAYISLESVRQEKIKI